MSQYGDYSQRIFNEIQRDQIGDSSQNEGEFIDFKPVYTFRQSRVQNVEFQNFHYQEKQFHKDTNCSVNTQQKVEKSINLERKIRKIEFGSGIKKQYLRNKKGNPYQTMQLNINYKTIFSGIIQQLSDLKLLKYEEKELFLKYKQQSPSFRSLINFINSMNNNQSQLKLKQLIESSKIILKIKQSDMKMQNKIAMIKYLQVMRQTIIKYKRTKKWK